MTRPAGAKLTPEVARELCQRAGSKAYIAAAIGSLGSDDGLQFESGKLSEWGHCSGRSR
jgi:hypothetical protein